MDNQGQLQAIGSEGTDVVNTRVVPIVMVPGVMGTRLDISGTIADWDPDDATEMLDWVGSSTGSVRKRIDFRTGGTPMTTIETSPLDDILVRPRLVDIATKGKRAFVNLVHRANVASFWEKRGWGGLVWNFYGRILMQLADDLNPGAGTTERHPVYAVGYDWRNSLRDAGRLLKRRIDEILKEQPLAKQVVLVTHSMGGLVARGALLEGAEPKIGGVLHTVQPADGAVVAYRRFFTGATSEFGDEPFPLNVIMGNSAEEYIETQSGARGPIELMPHDTYPETFLRMPNDITNKFFDDIFGEYARNGIPGIVSDDNEFATELRNRLREARVSTRSIANRFHPKTRLLLGNVRQTDMEFDWRAGTVSEDIAAMAPMVVRRAQGDGTVPGPSAECRGSSALSSAGFNVGHADCFDVKDFRDAALSRVRLLLADL